MSESEKIQKGLFVSYAGDANWRDNVAGAPRLPHYPEVEAWLRAQGVPEDILTVAVSYYGPTAVDWFDFPYVHLGSESPRALLAKGPRGVIMLRSALTSLYH